MRFFHLISHTADLLFGVYQARNNLDAFVQSFPPRLVHTPKGSRAQLQQPVRVSCSHLPLDPLLISVLGDDIAKDGAHPPRNTAGLPPPSDGCELGVTVKFSHLPNRVGTSNRSCTYETTRFSRGPTVYVNSDACSGTLDQPVAFRPASLNSR